MATLSTFNNVYWANTSTSTFTYSCGGTAQLAIAGDTFTVTNAPAGAVTAISMSLWFPVVSTTTWTRTNASTCWSVPAATGATTVVNGVTFREFTSTFSCTATVSGGTYSMPSTQQFAFRSSCQPSSTLPSLTYHYTQTATTATGQKLLKDNGWGNVMTG